MDDAWVINFIISSIKLREEVGRSIYKKACVCICVLLQLSQGGFSLHYIFCSEQQKNTRESGSSVKYFFLSSSGHTRVERRRIEKAEVGRWLLRNGASLSTQKILQFRHSLFTLYNRRREHTFPHCTIQSYIYLRAKWKWEWMRWQQRLTVLTWHCRRRIQKNNH